MLAVLIEHRGYRSKGFILTTLSQERQMMNFQFDVPAWVLNLRTFEKLCDLFPADERIVVDVARKNDGFLLPEAARTWGEVSKRVKTAIRQLEEPSEGDPSIVRNLELIKELLYIRLHFDRSREKIIKRALNLPPGDSDRVIEIAIEIAKVKKFFDEQVTKPSPFFDWGFRHRRSWITTRDPRFDSFPR